MRQDLESHLQRIEKDLIEVSMEIDKLEREVADSANPDEKIPVGWKTIDRTITKVVNGESVTTIMPTKEFANKFTTLRKQFEQVKKRKVSLEKLKAKYLKLLTKYK